MTETKFIPDEKKLQWSAQMNGSALARSIAFAEMMDEINRLETIVKAYEKDKNLLTKN